MGLFPEASCWVDDLHADLEFAVPQEVMYGNSYPLLVVLGGMLHLPGKADGLECSLDIVGQLVLVVDEAVDVSCGTG